MISRRKSKVSSTVKLKNFETFYAKRPVQCQCCHDYILGPSKPLQVCQECKAVLHPICAFFAHTSDCFNSMSEYQMQLQESSLSKTPVSFSEWSVDAVREWIAASESYRYFYIFNSKQSKITGFDMTEPDRILKLFRADDLHKHMLREAIENATKVFPEQVSLSEMNEQSSEGQQFSGHEFSKYECYCTFRCNKCNLSRGVMSYGVKCKKCGMHFHRMCKIRPNLPVCPERSSQPKDYVFGQDLSTGFSLTDQRVPLFLKICTSIIEERLQASDKSIYVSSIKCIRLQELCTKHGLDIFSELNSSKPVSPPNTTFEELEATLKTIENLDEIAGLVKSYLRELPNPVIPFHVYDDMICVAKKQAVFDDEFICSIVEKISLPHRFALSHILQHIQRINGFFRSDSRLSSLFAAFGTVLVRPPPHSVRSLATWERGVDLHSLIVKIVYGNVKFKDISSSLASPGQSPKTMMSRISPTLGLGAASHQHSTQMQSQNLDSDGTTSSSQGGPNSDVYIQFSAIEDPTPSSAPISATLASSHDSLTSWSSGLRSDSSKKHSVSGPSIRNYEPMKPFNRNSDGSFSATTSNVVMVQTKVEELPEFPIIANLPYYWQDISKNQEKLLMENEAIGNFILRQSSSDPSALTLVVKSFDLNFLVKISNYKSGKGEGWAIAAGAPTFATISELVQYYQSNDLSTSPYLPNAQSSASLLASTQGGGDVDMTPSKNSASLTSSQTRYSQIRLREPVNKEIKEEEDLNVTRELLKSDSEKVDQNETDIADLKRKLSFIKETQVPHIKRKEALLKLLKQLETQIETLNNKKRGLTIEDQRRLVLSDQFVEARLGVARSLIEECDVVLEKLHDQKVEMESKLHMCTTKFSAEIRQQTKRRILLELGGVSYEDELTPQQTFNGENSSLWFYKNRVTRAMATSMFEVCREHGIKENGIFMVRSSTEGGYAISVLVNDEVMHVKVQYEDQKYGFSYPYINYSSPVDLVVAYTETSLVMHNHNLDTTLTTPIGKIIESNPVIKAKIDQILHN